MDRVCMLREQALRRKNAHDIAGAKKCILDRRRAEVCLFFPFVPGGASDGCFAGTIDGDFFALAVFFFFIKLQLLPGLESIAQIAN